MLELGLRGRNILGISLIRPLGTFVSLFAFSINRLVRILEKRVNGSVVITRFTRAVIKSRPLKRVGAEQVSHL